MAIVIVYLPYAVFHSVSSLYWPVGLFSVWFLLILLPIIPLTLDVQFIMFCIEVLCPYCLIPVRFRCALLHVQ